MCWLINYTQPLPPWIPFDVKSEICRHIDDPGTFLNYSLANHETYKASLIHRETKRRKVELLRREEEQKKWNRRRYGNLFDLFRDQPVPFMNKDIMTLIGEQIDDPVTLANFARVNRITDNVVRTRLRHKQIEMANHKMRCPNLKV